MVGYGIMIDVLSRKILRELCTNARTTSTEIAGKLGISRYTVVKHIETLERELGLYYTIEPNYKNIGFDNLHVLRISFDKRPMPNEIALMFFNSGIAQFAATTKGDYDMLVFATCQSPVEYLKWETALDIQLSKYGVSIRSSEISVMHLGFIPLTDKGIDKIEIDPIYKKIMLQLNKNSRISIRELGRSTGMSENLARYYLKKMEGENVIKRYTTLVTKSPLKHIITFFVSYTIREGVIDRINKERRTMYWKETPEFPVVSEFPIMWSVSGSDRSFTAACYGDYKEGMRNSVKAHLLAYKEDSPKAEVGVIDKVIVGMMPIRNIDMKASYNTVLWPSEVK